MKVLIVDDTELNTILLNEILYEYYQIFIALSGEQALKTLEAENPDIVLLDILMPVMDGYQVLRKIKNLPKFSQTIVIMVTAKTERDDVKLALEYGADDYIKKPIDATELLTKIEIHKRIIMSRRKASEYETYLNIHESMVSSRRIQQQLLPEPKFLQSIFPESFVLFLPKDMLSGDFYFVHRIDSKVFIAVFDCTGHGVPAALLTTINYMVLNNIVRQGNETNPLKVFNLLKNELAFHFNKDTDTYAAYNTFEGLFIEINLMDNILTFVSLNQPLILVQHQNEKSISYSSVNSELADDNKKLYRFNYNRAMVNSDLDLVNLDEQKISYNHGDKIYFFTDGFFDQLGGLHLKRYSKQKFLNLLFEVERYDFQYQKSELYKEFFNWKGSESQTDDILVVGLNL